MEGCGRVMKVRLRNSVGRGLLVWLLVLVLTSKSVYNLHVLIRSSLVLELLR